MQIAIVVIGVLSGVSMVYTAFQFGKAFGVLAERERREGLEARIRQEIETATRRDRELWETEIDA
jgi:hypothetical protein